MIDFLVYSFQRMSEILNKFFLKLFIIKILGRSLKITCKNYNIMCDILKTNIN